MDSSGTHFIQQVSELDCSGHMKKKEKSRPATYAMHCRVVLQAYKKSVLALENHNSVKSAQERRVAPKKEKILKFPKIDIFECFRRKRIAVGTRMQKAYQKGPREFHDESISILRFY
jgi:hypothetical protein